MDVFSLPRKPIGVYDDAAVIAIDGTWSQSKGLYSQNPRLHDAIQVCHTACQAGLAWFMFLVGPTKCWSEWVCDSHPAHQGMLVHFGVCGSHTGMAGKWWRNGYSRCYVTSAVQLLSVVEMHRFWPDHFVPSANTSWIMVLSDTRARTILTMSQDGKWSKVILIFAVS